MKGSGLQGDLLPSYLPKCYPAPNGDIEMSHPLDLLQHYWELRALGHAPLLHLQRPGEVLCFPEGWYHSTVNLGPHLSIAFKLHREVSYGLPLYEIFA